jgi:DNA-binding CsgD family transcriptional regulator
VSDLDEGPLHSTARLRNAFALTAAEARVASLLSAGHDLGTIADTLKISRETVRNQLKSIFSKTETSRQAELISVMARIYPNERGDGPNEQRCPS